MLDPPRCPAPGSGWAEWARAATDAAFPPPRIGRESPPHRIALSTATFWRPGPVPATAGAAGGPAHLARQGAGEEHRITPPRDLG